MDLAPNIMNRLAEGDVGPKVIASVLMGLIFHQSIRSIEFELFVAHFATASLLALLGCIYTLGFWQAILLLVSFNASLLFSIATYRLFFHRLHSFPGPFGAKLSRFHATRLTAKNVQYYKELAKMHSQYGDFVRTGPREISVLRKAAVLLLYGPKSECLKSTWYGQAGNDPTKCSIHMTRDFDSHRLRRRTWDKGLLSPKALSAYEPRIKAKADLLRDQMAKSSGSPMDMTAWAMFFNFDVMGDVGFGKDFNCLASGVEHSAITGAHAHMALLSIMSTVPWFLNLLGSIPGVAGGYTEFFAVCADQIREKYQTWDSQADPQDIMSWLLKAVEEKDASASPSAAALQEDARVMIIAGSETTATTFASALFYLAKFPDKQSKLQKLLDKAMPNGYSSWTYDRSKTPSYLDDIINETLRLRPPLFAFGTRETPAEGIVVDEMYIPGHTNVNIPISLIQRDARYWKHADSFLPERFGEQRHEWATDDAPFVPFSMGVYGCPGKSLAMLSLRIALSVILRCFDVGFAPGETGKAFEHDALDTLTVVLPPLLLRFTARRQ